MSRIAFVGDRRFCSFLKNFDFEVFPAKNGEEVSRKVRELLQEGKYALIVFKEEFFPYLRDVFDRLKKPLPILFMIPSSKDRSITIDYVNEMVERAVGIDILSKSKG